MSVKIGAELIHIVGEMVALRFEIPNMTEGTDVASDSLYAMFAVDKSGSMSGSPINDAKGAAESLTSKFRLGDIPVSIYLFDSRHKEYHSDQDGYDTIIDRLKQLDASGGTIFANVMQAIEKRIKEKSLRNVFCVWLTDGQDNRGINTLTPIMEAQKNYFESEGISIAVHCIGFSSGHDANLLATLSQSGTKAGTFQYVPEGGRIPVAVNNIYTLAFESSTWARFLGSGNTNYKVIIEHEEGVYKALVYVSENDLEDCKVEIHQGSLLNVCDLEPTRGDYRSIEDIVHLVTAFVASKVTGALEKGMAEAKQKLGELAGTIEEAERRINGLYQDCSSLRPYKRKQLIPFFTVTQQLVKQYKDIVASPDPLENVEFANINSTANNLFLKRNLEKKIAKEAGENFRLLFESDEKVDRLISDFDKKALEEKHAGYLATRNLKCALSSESWLDLLVHGDCLCVTFELERPQNLLGVANEIKIKNVNNLIVSHDGYLNSALFETKAGQIIQGARNYAHGQAPSPVSKYVPGLSEEKVNGVLPIYINEDHWKIASLRFPQMLAYNVSVDVLGFNQEQVLEFPFMAYSRALEQNSELLIEVLRDTCDQVYRENKAVLLERVNNILTKYLVDPLFRTTVKSNTIFLGWLAAALRAGDVSEYKHLLVHVLEEEIRRNFQFAPIQKINELAVKFLKIDLNPFYEEVRKSLMNGVVSYAENFRRAPKVDPDWKIRDKPIASEEKKEEGEEREEREEREELGEWGEWGENNKSKEKDETPQVAEAEGFFSFEGRIEELSEEASLNIDKINSSMMQDGSLFKIVQLFKELNYPVKTLADLGLTENEQLLSFVLQALGYKKDRKEALESKLYTTTFSGEESLMFIRALYSISINKEILAYRSKLISEMSSDEGRKKAAVFEMTNDLEEAAGCLYGIHQGAKSFPLFFEALKSPNVPEIIEKIKMITYGNYKKVKLVFDEMKGSNGFVAWKPNKKTVHKIWALNKDAAPKELWQEAFPHKFEYFEHHYLRLAGSFVPYTSPRKNVIDPRHWEGKSKAKKAHPNPGKLRAPKAGRGGRVARGSRGGRGGAGARGGRAARGGARGRP